MNTILRIDNLRVEYRGREMGQSMKAANWVSGLPRREYQTLSP